MCGHHETLLLFLLLLLRQHGRAPLLLLLVSLWVLLWSESAMVRGCALLGHGRALLMHGLPLGVPLGVLL